MVMGLPKSVMVRLPFWTSLWRFSRIRVFSLGSWSLVPGEDPEAMLRSTAGLPPDIENIGSNWEPFWL